MPSSVPTISIKPTGYWDRPHLQQSLPSESPSIQPTSSINPSVEHSSLPSQSDKPSEAPSGVPSLSKLPTDQPSSTQAVLDPTSPPSEGLVIQGREFNPCEESQVVLVGATVSLFSVLGQQIDQTITDSEGRWEFVGLPQGRYFTITDYPECRRVLEEVGSLNPEEINLSDSLFEEQTIKFFNLPLTATSSHNVDHHHQDDKPLQYSTTSSQMPRFYPTFVLGQLCNSKISFDSWEESYGSLEECCTTHFSWNYEACCKSKGMGGC